MLSGNDEQFSQALCHLHSCCVSRERLFLHERSAADIAAAWQPCFLVSQLAEWPS